MVFPRTIKVTPPEDVYDATEIRDDDRPNRDRPIGRVRIEDIRRCLAEDLAESDAVAAGYKGLEDFRAVWSREGGRDVEEILVLVDFHLEAHR